MIDRTAISHLLPARAVLGMATTALLPADLRAPSAPAKPLPPDLVAQVLLHLSLATVLAALTVPVATLRTPPCVAGPASPIVLLQPHEPLRTVQAEARLPVPPQLPHPDLAPAATVAVVI